MLSPKNLSPKDTNNKFNKNMFRSLTKNELAKSPGFLSRNTCRAGDTLEEVKLLINTKSRQSPEHSFSLASVGLRMTIIL